MSRPPRHGEARVLLIEIAGVAEDGELIAHPIEWKGEGKPPTIYIRDRGGRSGPALGRGDRALVRMMGSKRASLIKRIAPAPRTVIGVYDGSHMIRSTQRAGLADYFVSGTDAKGAEKGELVLAEILPTRRMERPRAKILERLGSEEGTRQFSLIAIRNNDIPYMFSDEALAEAAKAGAPGLEGRVDLRDVQLVTIDGEDARDFDDAVWATSEELEDGSMGWHLIVAIADVAWYVRPGSALDKDAVARGNSTYFPDRVVPMLPEALSNGWCSLKPHEERACLVAHIWIDGEGNMLRHRFERALMRSAARLTYNQVQQAKDKGSRELANIITPLYGAFAALLAARNRRETLEIVSKERYVVLDDKGEVTKVVPRPQLDSHKLIEEFMIAANVAAAETLEKLRQPVMYRIHDAPPADKIMNFADAMEEMGLPFARGQVVRPSAFNRLIERAAKAGIAESVSDMVLRAQAQAEYSTRNIGHYGLALRHYCHFTSPIRRYADLLVHRALITGLKMGPGGLPAHAGDLGAFGTILSAAERRSVSAEREAQDRFVASYYSRQVGELAEGRIAGEAKSGYFVRLDDTLADGFVPKRGAFEQGRRGARGRKGKQKGQQGYEMGDRVTVRILEADGVRGSLVLEILDRQKKDTAHGKTD